jgi:hypothetical protein
MRQAPSWFAGCLWSGTATTATSSAARHTKAASLATRKRVLLRDTTFSNYTQTQTGENEAVSRVSSSNLNLQIKQLLTKLFTTF